MDYLGIIGIIVDVLGTIATVISVIWAIHIYKKAYENKVILEVKENIMQLPETCEEINFLLETPENSV